MNRVEQISAATPETRNREVDALRVVATLGVVAGHWLVTAFVDHGDGVLSVASPLAAGSRLQPLTWLFQTLAPFFLVGGYAAALGARPGEGYTAWLRRKLGRLAGPVPALLGFWAALLPALWVAGLAPSTLQTIFKLVLSPLWFLGVFAGLTALAPLLARLWDRLGYWSVASAAGIVALVDAGRFAFAGPSWLGWVNLLAGWTVPFLLGIGWARGRPPSRRASWGLFGGGITATLGLVAFAGYPASMVGVPGEAISNLNPPTLAAVTFGLAQAGLAFLVRDRLGRLMERPRLWAAVVAANLSALTVFLWHQTAMMVTTVGALLFGGYSGLHGAPSTAGWAAGRMLWFPVFAAVLFGLWLLFHRFERATYGPAPDRRPRRAA